MRGQSENSAALLAALLTLLASSWLLPACGVSMDDDDSAVSDDDDDSTPGDDDDSTPAPDPLAPVIGLFNLTNVVQGSGQSYVDFSGAFGSAAETPEAVFSIAAYLATFSYGADAPYWRLDLGAFPLPAEGEAVYTDMLTYYPWTPAEQTWWDGGRRIGAGNYLTSAAALKDVMAYQVDDPVNPGALGWSAGGTLRWENEGGTPVVAWAMDEAIQLPQAMDMTTPLPSSEVSSPAAHPFTVEWNPASDGSYVTLGVLSADDMAWVTRIPDSGSYTLPAEVLREDFGPGEVELVLGRTVEQSLPHPQGDIILRAREERRSTLRLLPDLVIEPAYAEAGQTVQFSVGWFTQDLSSGATVDLGDGINVVSVLPDPSDIHRAEVTIQVAQTVAPGPRDVTITLPSGVSETLSSGFAILSLAPSDDCDDAANQTALGSGNYVSTTSGLANDYSSGLGCVPWSLNGADAVYPILLEAGETLIASLSQGVDSDPALILLSDCADATSALACADTGITGEDELLVYTTESAGLFYLVVDSWVGSMTAPSSAFELGITIERNLIDPDWILPGETRMFTLFGEVPWASGILAADINLGTGIGIEATAAGSTPTELDILATASPSAPVGPRDIVIDNGAAGLVSLDEGLWVTGWPSYNSCSDAIPGDAVDLTSAVGYGVQVSSSIDDVPCMPYASGGPDVILPIQLFAGQLFSATVLSSEDTQLYILSDCNDPTSCFDDAVADEGVAFDEEVITDWLVPITGRYYLVVDLWAPPEDPTSPWLFDLTLTAN